MNDMLAKLLEAVKAKEVKKSATVKKYADKAKVKALTDKERLDRIEELLGLK